MENSSNPLETECNECETLTTDGANWSSSISKALLSSSLTGLFVRWSNEPTGRTSLCQLLRPGSETLWCVVDFFFQKQLLDVSWTSVGR